MLMGRMNSSINNFIYISVLVKSAIMIRVYIRAYKSFPCFYKSYKEITSKLAAVDNMKLEDDSTLNSQRARGF
jgi:hypothetical protein